MRVDAHQHFWRYDALRYAWIGSGMERLKRDFLPPDLESEINAAGIERVVSVQARSSLEETDWLLGLASEFEFIAGVVGWVPLLEPDAHDQLASRAANPLLKGVRHVLQDEPDEGFMLRADFNRGVGLLNEFSLVYDILIYPRQLPQTIQMVDRHPGQVFVLDHLAKPRIRDHQISPWREQIRELALRDNVYCKLSGMVTEADWDSFSEKELQPYLEVVTEAFTPQRLMFGSDWPVCLLACEYSRWLSIVHRFCDSLSLSERARVQGGTAVEVYRLSTGTD